MSVESIAPLAQAFLHAANYGYIDRSTGLAAEQMLNERSTIQDIARLCIDEGLVLHRYCITQFDTIPGVALLQRQSPHQLVAIPVQGMGHAEQVLAQFTHFEDLFFAARPGELCLPFHRFLASGWHSID